MQALLLTLTGRSSPPGACRGRRPPGSWLQDHCWVSVATQEVWGQSQPQVSGGPYPGRALGLSSALRSCSSSPYLDYATEFLSRWSPVKGRPLKLTSRVPPSPGPRAREPAPSRDHQTGMERGRQEEDSSAIPSLETHPSFQLSQGTNRHATPSWAPFPHGGQAAYGGWCTKSTLLRALLLSWNWQDGADSPQSASLLRG